MDIRGAPVAFVLHCSYCTLISPCPCRGVIQVLVTVRCPLHCSHCTHSAVPLVMLSTDSTIPHPRSSGNSGESCLYCHHCHQHPLWVLIPRHDILHSSAQVNPFIPSGAPPGNNTDNIISIRHNLNILQYWRQEAADNITSLDLKIRVGGAFLLHHVLADQWAVVIIILMNTQKTWLWIFFGSFMLWPEVIILKIATLSKGVEPRPSCIIFCSTGHPCA